MTRTVVTALVAALMFVFTAGPAFAQSGDQRVEMDAKLSQTVLARQSSNQVYLDVALQPERRVSSTRVPLNIALVIDKSGSMSSSDKIGFAREAAMSIIDQLESYDRVSIVTFDSNVQVALPSMLASDREAIKRVIAGISTGSNTALHGGMTTGGSEIRRHYNNEFLNRVILLSDGKANVGPSSNNQLASAARSLGDEGISVTTMGLGLDYNEDTMTAIADAAGGNYYFIESGDQMAYQFQQELSGMMQVAALQTTINILVAPGVTVRDVYGYDFTQTGNIVSIRVGDLIGGRSLNVTALLDVDSSDAERMTVGSVALAYTDAVDGQARKLKDDLVAELSGVQEEQEKSRDMDVGARAQEVVNAEAIATAMDSYAAGNDDEAKEILSRARAETESFNAGAGMAAAPALEAQLDSVMMDMEEAEDDMDARGAVVKSKKAGARSSSRGQ
jgi:Ca-activated chloride channel family protein